MSFTIIVEKEETHCQCMPSMTDWKVVGRLDKMVFMIGKASTAVPVCKLLARG